MQLSAGPRNLITDVAGVSVGHAQDPILASGVTAIVFDAPATASVDVRGGGPGVRETELLAPERTVSAIDALCLSGGSAFGLDAAAGVMAALAEQGRGFAVGPARVPIVPAAILFDLLNGGDKNWGRYPPYRELGFDAVRSAGQDFALGSVGAGLGAQTATLKGGLGSASAVMQTTGITIGALAAVNALGSATVGDGPHFWAAPFELEDEFGGLGPANRIPPDAWFAPQKPVPGAHTTLALVATDASLTKAEAKALASVANDGLARALLPCHTPLDGDIVFAVSTGQRQIGDDRTTTLAALGHVAALTLSRAVARAVYEAEELPFAGALPSWKAKFGARAG
ncbi:P1 family peptidase [Hansschlegelia beijingensis]|uniref:L-aminopeptidase/D-esterase-like protein n=1 Tax=Hansschlegelia beijingensis TaxID=1133344 RepID=A0A7W6D0P0_9HYPH|nr:P1 family peptidase [Hansschlegelia beijingensis]MBB3973719.1 L-aminopeptidase/D-esterase-like protein [Hansschlegelia beijingensis]